MRKLGIVVALAAVLVLAGCGDDGGSDDASTTEDSSSSTDNGDSGDSRDSGGSGDTDNDDSGTDTGDAEAGDEASNDAEGSGGGDVSAALLVAEDLPADADLTPLDIAGVAGGMAGMTDMLEGIAYDPADCKDNSADPLLAEGVDAAAMSATTGEGANIEVLVNAAYAGASADDFDGLTDYYERCGEIAITGSVQGQEVDMVTKTTVVEAPELDADAVMAVEVAVESQMMPAVPQRLVYVVAGEYGAYVAANADSTAFDVDALAAVALERLQSL